MHERLTPSSEGICLTLQVLTSVALSSITLWVVAHLRAGGHSRRHGLTKSKGNDKSIVEERGGRRDPLASTTTATEPGDSAPHSKLATAYEYTAHFTRNASYLGVGRHPY